MAIHRPNPMSFTHSLAYVYFYLAHHGDREGITKPEVDAIITKIMEWNQYLTRTIGTNFDVSVSEVMVTLDYFKDLTREEEDSELAFHLAALTLTLETPQKRAVIADMLAISRADGHVSEGEKVIIALVDKCLATEVS